MLVNVIGNIIGGATTVVVSAPVDTNRILLNNGNNLVLNNGNYIAKN